MKKNNKGIKQSKLSNVNQSISKKNVCKDKETTEDKILKPSRKAETNIYKCCTFKKKRITKCYLHVEQYTTNISLQCFYKIVSKN